jgi:carbonic anhydrase
MSHCGKDGLAKKILVHVYGASSKRDPILYIIGNFHMNAFPSLLSCLFAGLMPSGTRCAAEWNYDTHGPAKWTKLRPEYTLCSEGKSQSPIDINTTISGHLASPKMGYRASAGKVVDNGHAIEWIPQEKMILEIDQKTYTLRQIHGHAPSEHQLNGVTFPAEAHLVHQDKEGKLLVVGVFLKKGRANAFVDPMLIGLETPEKAPARHPMALIPEDKKIFRYSGSLTTPPCTGGVQWIVMQDMMTLSPDQLARLTAKHKDNARPVQDHNARLIIKQ